ncbi:MAG: hypothetical protein EA362_10695 [Saprospirales bacterium]|nr:MAG: hypothetical protein EA362_10695 [Saprospirales bacterium]
MFFGARVTIKKSILLLSMVWGFFFIVGTNHCFSQADDFKSTISDFKKNAETLRVMGDYSSAREVLYEALDLANEQEERGTIARIHNQLGVLGIYEYKFPEALSSLQKALTIYRDLDDPEGIAECLNNIAAIHMSMNNYSQAKENYQQNLKIREGGSDFRKLGIAYNNLGVVFNRLDNLDSALYYLHLGQGIWEVLDDSVGIGVTLNLIGGILRDQGELEGALNVKKESLMMLKSSSKTSLINIEIVTSEIGHILSMLGRNEELIDKCEDLCFNIDRLNSLSSGQKCCNVLYQAYSNLANYPKALKAYKRYSQFKDSILGTQAVQQITKLELNYAFEQISRADSLRFQSEKQLQQERINRQRTGLFAVGGILFLLGLLTVVILRAKKRSEELLLNILPAEIAKELKQTGKAQPRKYESVSVIFADIKGFTQISEKLSPEKLLEEINIYFTAFDQIMEKYQIEKIKTIGDCYMSVSGLPELRDDHALRAVKAALEMQDFVRAQQTVKKVKNEPFFEIRIGIHSGPVVAGIVGTKKFQYDIWGDTVNTANRLETNCEVGKVNISEVTYELVKNHFDFSYRGKIETKGKGSISMYYIEPKSKSFE